MSCTSPHYALDLGLDSATGKRKIKFLPNRADLNLSFLKFKYGEDSVLCLPCGKCLQCKLDYAKEWAVRCTLESLYYPDCSYFITLTYDEAHVPDKLLKCDFQNFIKAIRNDGFKVRYFGCGEYGDNTQRPHFHLMLYGLKLGDLKLYNKCSTGYLFNSATIDKYWNKGFAVVADGSFNCAGYIARYCLKKLTKDNVSKDEFILMSKKPGIGERYLLDHKEEILKYGNIVGSFGSSHVAVPPRYFEKLMEKYNIDINRIKDSRLDLSKKFVQNDLIHNAFVHEEQLWSYKKQLGSRKLNFHFRGL